MRESTRNRLQDEGIRSAYKALECLAACGVTRWDPVTVLKAMCGDIHDPQIIAAVRDAVATVRAVQAQERARRERAEKQQAAAARTYMT